MKPIQKIIDLITARVPALSGGNVPVVFNIPATGGAQANAWNAAVVGVAGVSNAINVYNNRIVSVFGNSNAITNVTVQYSFDGVNFYDSSNVIALDGASDFGINIETASPYIRLKSSLAATITATVAFKS